MMKTGTKMLNSLPEITHIRQSGFFDFRLVNSLTWDKTRAQWALDPDFPILLPTWRNLKRFGKRREVKLMLDKLVFDIYFRNQTHWRFTFYKGFLTDFASVPAYFRSIVDNDDIDMIAAALCHDRNFSDHQLTFKQTNELFYKMVMMRDGAPGSDDVWIALPIRAKIAWLAVKSFVGRIKWKQNARRRNKWTKQTSKFERVRG